jgi:hypothetical protein
MVKRSESLTRTLKAKALLVLGMHRSGTSALTRVCNLLEANLGANLLPSQSDNETGFWEQREIRDIHDNLLIEFGSRWDDHRPMPRDWFHSPQSEKYKLAILDVLRRDFAHSKIWMVKDPRISRLVPFWASIVEAMESEPCFLLMVRNPLEVAGSLEKRNHFPPPRSILSWLRHLLDAERDTRSYPRAVITYDRLLSDWRKTIADASDRLRLDWAEQMERQGPKIDEFISTKHRHHAVMEEQLSADPLVAGWAREVYAIFEQMASGQGRNIPDRLDRLARELDNAEQLFAPWLAVQQTEIAARAAQIEELTTDLASTRSELSKHDDHANQLSVELATAQTKVLACDVTIEEFERKIETARSESTARATQIQDLSRELDWLRAGIAARDTKVQELCRELESIRVEVTARDARLGELSTELTAAVRDASARESELRIRSEELAAARTEVFARGACVEVATHELDLAKSEIAQRDARIDELSAEIAGIHQSWSWRLTRSARRIGNLAEIVRPKQFLFHMDVPGPHEVVGPEFTVSGWCVSLGQAGVKSVRIRAGQDTFPGVYGLPRSDVAEAYNDRMPGKEVERCGFQVAVRLPTGRRQLALEAQDQSGRWIVFGKHPVVVSPLHAHLEQPAMWRQKSGNITFSGWCFHPTRTIRKLSLVIDKSPVVCIYGFDCKTDWGRVDFPHQGKVGFLVTCFVWPGQQTVSLVAQLDNGEEISISVPGVLKTVRHKRQPNAVRSPLSTGSASVTSGASKTETAVATERPAVVWRAPGRGRLHAKDRWCVYSHFSAFNTIDPHVQAFLQNIDRCGWNIVFVTASKALSEPEREKISSYVRHFIQSNNVGRDWGNYLLGIQHLGPQARGSHLMLLNDSVYGPLFDLSALFDAYFESGADLYGISDSYERAHHIQSYCLICGPRFTASSAFGCFWQQYSPGRAKEEVINRHEVGFSVLALRSGHKLGAFCPYTEVRQAALAKEGTYAQKVALLHPMLNPTHFWWDLLISEFRCPVLKVELMGINPSRIPNLHTFESLLQQKTNYDPQLIRQHLDKLLKVAKT